MGQHKVFNLIYRGIKKKDELTIDYVQRLARINGFSKIEIFENYLERTYHLNCCDSNGSSKYNKCRIALEGILKRNIPEGCLDRIRLGKGNSWSKCVKVCKACLQKSDYIRFYWRLRNYKKCHLHGDWLIPLAEELDDFSKDDAEFEKYPPLYIYELIDSSLDDEKCQDKIVDELEMVEYERAIIRALKLNLSLDGVYKLDFSKAFAGSASGRYLGLSAQDRVFTIVHDLDSTGLYKQVLLRVIALMICNPRREGAFCKITWREKHDDYRRFSMLFLGSDNLLSALLYKIRDFSSLDIDEIPIVDLVDGGCVGVDLLSKKIKLASYYCRFFDSDVAESLRMESSLVGGPHRKPSLYQRFLISKRLGYKLKL
ncbi:MAG: hypothetical protein JWM78_159 [Verrucomicrobiaceae bacterium]|nr:hypothetical protein [Verrucomicrobiaceae bacterium]